MTRTINYRGIKDTRRIKRFRVFVSPWFARILLWCLPLAFLIVFFFFPLSKILKLTFTFEAFNAENLRVTYSALRFTFYQAILSTILTLILGLPSAILFARYDF